MDAASSSPSGARMPAVNDGVACSALLAMNEDPNISAEKDDFSEMEHISVEEDGSMDVDEENEDDDGEASGLEGEDFTQIFKVDDDVWETKNFSKWRKLNWLCFDSFSRIDDYYFDIPKDCFDPGEDPRSERPLELKMGHSLLYYDMDEPWAGLYLREATDGARLAIEFFNKENKKGKTLKFQRLCRIRTGLHFYKPRGRVYFLTFMTTYFDVAERLRELEASLFQPSKDKKTWHLRAVREKPFDYFAS